MFFAPGIHLIIHRSRRPHPHPSCLFLPCRSLPRPFPFRPGRPRRLMRTPLKARIHKWMELCTGNVFKLRFHIRWLRTIRAIHRRRRLLSAPRGAQQRKYPPMLFHGADVYVGYPTLLAGDVEASGSIWITSRKRRGSLIFRRAFARIKSNRAIMDSHTYCTTSAPRISPSYHAVVLSSGSLEV